MQLLISQLTPERNDHQRINGLEFLAYFRVVLLLVFLEIFDKSFVSMLFQKKRQLNILNLKYKMIFTVIFEHFKLFYNSD